MNNSIVWAFQRTVTIPWLRTAFGGIVVILLTPALGQRDYPGLGVNANPNAPNAVTVQSCLLSSGFVIYAAIACFLSWFLSGNSSIYHTQRVSNSASET